MNLPIESLREDEDAPLISADNCMAAAIWFLVGLLVGITGTVVLLLNLWRPV